MIIRLLKPADIEAANEIYESARVFMRGAGNPDQWNTAYPSKADIEAGIADGTSFVCEDEREIVAAFYFKIGDDPTYGSIDGSWQNEEPYAVIHRIAVKYRGRSIAEFCFDECAKMFPNIKIDTHKDNIPMQKCLKKNGFVYCGIIKTWNGEPRLAYQRQVKR